MFDLDHEDSFFPNGSFESWLDDELQRELQKESRKKDPITEIQNRLKRIIPKIQQGLWCTADKRVLKITEQKFSA